MSDFTSRPAPPPPPNPPPQRHPTSGPLSWLLTALPTLLALAFLGGIAAWGFATDWTLPKFDELTGETKKESEDWCKEHNVPESCCVECKPDLLPRPPKYGWCKRHGVHDCPLEHPDVAQLPTTPQVSEADRIRADKALAFAPRKENDDDCPLHPRRVQLASRQAMKRAGIETAKVRTGPITETVSAPGEITYDPTRVARVSSRVPGTVRRVMRQLGEPVRLGEALVLVDSVDVGRAKVDLLQAAAQVNLRAAVLDQLDKAEGVVPRAQLLEAQTALQEAKIRRLGAEQTLANLGLEVRPEQFKGLEPQALARRVRLLGLPPDLIPSLDDKLPAANLLPVRAPLAGEVVAREAVAGEVIDTRRVLLVIADTKRLWVTVHVRQEEGSRLAVGQPLRFQPDSGGKSIETKVSWLSPEVDPKTRTILVRAELTNEKGQFRANTFGEGTITQRVEAHAVLVPNDAVHWDGNCQVVFVLDKNSHGDRPVVFHARSVRTGARDARHTEILVGLLPGEEIATRGSAALRGQLLKDSLGGDAD